MNWIRWLERPRLLAALTLAFALVPAWLAIVTYRDARQKDERVFDTTAQVLGNHLQAQFEREAYFPRDMRNRAAALDDESIRSGKVNPAYPWLKQIPSLLAMGYAELADEKLIVRWKSEERVPVVRIGEDLAAIPGVLAAMKLQQSDPSPVAGCVTDQGRMILLLAQRGPEKGSPMRRYFVGWVDLWASCKDKSAPLIRDEVLSARPLVGNEPPGADTRHVELRILGAAWTAIISRGVRFSQQYGAPTPWLTFIAVGLSALPVLVLASLAGRSAKLRADLVTEREVARQQRFFTQSVSHEFRTPLGVILSGADLLENYSEKLSPERRAELITEIKSNTQHMTEMIEGLLLLGRIDSNRLSCEPRKVNVAGICREAAQKVATVTPGRSAIEVDAPEREVMMDASLLASILGNLLSNAVKYSPSDRPVNLRVRVDNLQCVFTVSDEGIGIPAHDVARVCDPFHRCGNVGDTPGTGLGLAIARRCAEVHGGTLLIQSVEGNGTTATVNIPIS